MVKDHLGNVYKTVKEMCDKYGLPVDTYHHRRYRDWDLETALTTDVASRDTTNFNKKECTDHLGNKFDSVVSMCKAYNIDFDVYKNRVRLGWRLEDILITPVNKRDIALDHRGIYYNSVEDMCKAYGITLEKFKKRMKSGWSLEEALTLKNVVKDHKGNEFRSKKEMCETYGIQVKTFDRRMQYGCKLGMALKLSKGCTDADAIDHLGNKYSSIHEMALHYGINKDIYVERIRHNWSVKKALTTPIRKKAKNSDSGEIVEDHLGNKYRSKEEMCNAYNILYATFRGRIDRGWSLKDALTTEPSDRYRRKSK